MRETLIWAALGNSVPTSVARLTNRRGVRIITYHQLADSAIFEAHLRHLVSHYRVIGADDFLGALAGVRDLPKAPVWITFDDGHPSAYEIALPLLREFGVPATLFVCGGMVDTSKPLWPEIVQQAALHEIHPRWPASEGPDASDSIELLKRLADTQRRELVLDLEDRLLNEIGLAVQARQLTTAELRDWVKAGNTVGNHTWDHPSLNRCGIDEQRVQIQRSHDRLTEILGRSPRLFAYPNGDWTREAEAVLSDLDYAVGVLHDHRMAHLGQPRYQISRLHAYGRSSPKMFSAMISGVHSGLLSRKINRHKARGVESEQRRVG